MVGAVVGELVGVGDGPGVCVASKCERVTVGIGVQVGRAVAANSTSAAVLTFSATGVTAAHSVSEPSTVTANTGQFCAGQSGVGVAVRVGVLVRVGAGVKVGRGVRDGVGVGVIVGVVNSKSAHEPVSQ